MAAEVIECHAFARAGLLGNPSDGYYGRTLSVVVRNFQATVTLEESAELRIEPASRDEDVFPSVEALVDAVSRQGYYGGARLVKASIKTFYDHCTQRRIALPSRNFTVRYRSSIPRQVGLGGSSAIVTATLRALMQFFEVEIPKERLPTTILSAETEELGITAGLQDRVTQVYEGLVYMDFARDLVERLGHGHYESLDAQLLPPLFIAYQTRPTKVSGQVLDHLRERWERGDVGVHESIDRIAGLASSGREALLQGRYDRFASLMNENFDLRRRVMHIHERDLAMVEAARALGTSAKLTGSGGAIVGALEDDSLKGRLAERLSALGASVIQPETKARNVAR